MPKDLRGADLFDRAPIPILRKDWSGVKSALAQIRASGVGDVVAHLATRPDVIEKLRTYHRFVDANRAAIRLLGAESKEHFFAVARQLLPANVASNIKVLEAFERGETTMQGERTLRTFDGRTVPIIWRGVILDEDAQDILFYAFDVSEQRRAQDALRAAQAELAHASRVSLLGELSASIAHEVKQPLAAIKIFSDAARRWLRADPPKTQEMANAINQIAQNATRAADVVDRIRAFSRKAQSDPAIVDGAALAHGALLLVEREAREHGVEHRLDAAPGAPKIRGDLVGLQQVLVNLLLNGIQAMAEAGSRPRRLAVSVAPNADLRRLEFRVRDSGPGIPAENRERIFAPFFSTKPNGMGMGLPSSTSMAESFSSRTPNLKGPVSCSRFRSREAWLWRPWGRSTGPKHLYDLVATPFDAIAC